MIFNICLFITNKQINKIYLLCAYYVLCIMIVTGNKTLLYPQGTHSLESYK